MIESHLQTILDVFLQYPYIILFAGLLVAGESVLLPAIYLAIAGELNIVLVMVIALMATMFSDLVWFYLGRHIGSGVLRRFMSDRLIGAVDRLSKPFDAHKAKVLFVSKFVYGTRIAAQVLAGARGMPVRRYIWVNTAGVFTLMSFLVVLGFSIDATVGGFETALESIRTAFLIFVAIVVVAHLIIGKIAKQSWYRQ